MRRKRMPTIQAFRCFPEVDARRIYPRSGNVLVLSTISQLVEVDTVLLNPLQSLEACEEAIRERPTLVIITSELDPELLQRLIRLCVESEVTRMSGVVGETVTDFLHGRFVKK